MDVAQQPPSRPLPRVDVGYAYGLPPDKFVVDGLRLELLDKAREALERSDALADDPSQALSSAASFAQAAQDPAVGLDADAARYFVWRDERMASGSQDADMARLLAVYGAALQAGATLRERAHSQFPGGVEAFETALTAYLAGHSIPAADQHSLDRVLEDEAIVEGARAVRDFSELGLGIAGGLDVTQDLRRALEEAKLPYAWGTPESPPALAQRRRAQFETGALASLSALLEEQARMAGLHLPEPTVQSRDDVAVAIQEYADARSFPLTKEEREAVASYAKTLSPQQARLVATIVGAAAKAESLASNAADGLSPRDAQLLQDAFTAGATQPEAWIPLLGKIDLLPLWEAAQTVAANVEAAARDYRALQQAGGNVAALTVPPGSSVPPHTDPLLVIGSPDAETFTRDAALYLDLGGDDRYQAPVGGGGNFGGLGLQGPGRGFFHLAVDLWGNDVYETGDMIDAAAFGAGTPGTLGMMFEYSGDDTYRVFTKTGAMSLGGAWDSIGTFIDYEGSDTYTQVSRDTTVPSTGVHFGSGNLGVGIFIDQYGNDVYNAQAPHTFGTGNLGHGTFLDLYGNDRYTSAWAGTSNGQTNAFGVGLLCVGEFWDFAGADSYVAGATTRAYGDANVGYGLFVDSAGSDSYAGGTTTSRGNEKVWTAGSLGTGIDTGSGGGQKPLRDLRLRIVSPGNHFKLAPGTSVEFQVEATNLGSVDAQDVRADFRVASREDDPAFTAGSNQSAILEDLPPLMFGNVPQGSRAVRTIRWTAPDTAVVRYLDAAASLQANAADIEPANSVDFVDFTVERVMDIRLDTLQISSALRVTPATDVPVRIELSSRSNSAAIVPVSITVTNQSGTPVHSRTFTTNQPVVPFSNVFDAASPPTLFNATLTWPTPDAEGFYQVRAWIPPDPQYNDACRPPAGPTCAALTSTQQVIWVVRLIDARVSHWQNAPVQDPDFFEGAQFRVFNGGTDPLVGRLVMTGERLLPTPGPKLVEEVDLAVQPDQATLVRMKPPRSPAPGYDETWLFQAEARIPDEKPATLGDNLAPLKVKFRKGVVFLDEFEENSPSYEAKAFGAPCAQEPIWERGTPTFRGSLTPSFKPFSGTSVWGTNLDGPICDGSRHDFVYRGLDLRGLLAPVRVEFMTAYDLFCCSAGGYVSASLEGQGDFQQLFPTGDYPCARVNPGWADDIRPMYCGNSNDWVAASFDLSDYAGQVIDLRFRAVPYKFCCNGGRAGWFLDDLALYGSRRLPGDAELLMVRTTPEPALLGVPTTIDLHVRNNGLVPINVSGLLRLTLGTTNTVVATTAGSLSNLDGGATGVIRVPWVPGAAKRYFVDFARVDVTSRVDSVQTNNRLDDLPLDVYVPLARDSLDALTECPPSCGGWTHTATPTTGPSAAPDIWQLGTPTDYPGGPRSPPNAWATDLVNKYPPGRAASISCCYGTSREYKLSSPEFTIPSPPATGYVEGDRFVLAFVHAYSLIRQIGQDSSGYRDQNDLAYVLARTADQGYLVAPEAGYPGYSYYNCFENEFLQSECGPPSVLNPDYRGWTGKSKGYEVAVLPLQAGTPPGTTFTFDFHLWSHYRASSFGQNRPGWTIDDVALLRAPRFENDLALVGMTPLVFNASSKNTVQVLVQNLGRAEYEPEQMATAFAKIRIELPSGGVMEFSSPLPGLHTGESRWIPFEFQAPHLLFGVANVTVAVDWTMDEWTFNNVGARTPARFGWLFYESDFERTDGGWTPAGNLGLKLGSPRDRAPIQGARSWYTGSLSGERSGSLLGPKINVTAAPGFRLKNVFFDGSVLFDGTKTGGLTKGLFCPYNGFRLLDAGSNQLLPLPGEPLHTLAWWPGGIRVNCGDYQPHDFRYDISNLQDTGARFQPRFDAWTAYFDCTCALREPNRGLEFDRFAAYGMPYRQNLILNQFLSPGGLVGPGGDAQVTVRVTNAGTEWPTLPVGVRLFTNRPEANFNEVRPLPFTNFSQSRDVSVKWRVPPNLEGSTLQLGAELVMRTATGWKPLADDLPADNIKALIVAVVSIHDLSITASAVPNLDPNQVQTPLLRITVENRGTLTEANVLPTVQVLDEAGRTVYEVPALSGFTLAPHYVQPPKRFEFAWAPATAGHYRLRALLDYPAQSEDVSPGDNQALSWIHVGVPAFGQGDDFDGAVSSWSAEAGRRAERGFAATYSKVAPEGNYTLRTNPNNLTYEPDARYRYELSVDLADTVNPFLSFVHKFDLAPGDVARVLASTDQGATWTLLAPAGGYGAAQGFVGRIDVFREATFGLSALPKDWVRLRLELSANGDAEAAGWEIDRIRVRDGSTTLVQQGFESELGPVQQFWGFESGAEGWAAEANPAAIDDWRVATPQFGVRTAHGGSKAWGTNMQGPYSTVSRGHKYLRSPEFTVPSDSASVKLAWWQFHEIQYSSFGFSPTTSYSDGVLVRLYVAGTPQIVTPETGYPWPVSSSSIGHPRAFTGPSGGWTFQTLDLKPFEGQRVKLEFDVVIPNGDSDFPRSFGWVVGPKAGLFVDDVSLHARPANVAGSSNVRINRLTVDPIASYLPATGSVEIFNEALEAVPAELEWVWTGSGGARIHAETRDVYLASGLQTETFELPANDTSQLAALMVRVRADGDPQPFDDVRIVPAHVQDVPLRTAFDAQPSDWVGDWPCLDVSPCAGWSHSGREDEWAHGPVPGGKFPSTPFSTPYAFGTDMIIGPRPQDGDVRYRYNSDQSLYSPTFEVPQTGAVLKFRHGMQSPGFGCCNWDGGQVYLNDVLLTPTKGYPKTAVNADGTCGAPISAGCYWGSLNWQEAEFDLDAFRGQFVELRFRFQSDAFSSNGTGWLIDDVAVLGRLPTPAADVALAAPAMVRVDPRYPFQFQVQALNAGTTGSTSRNLRVETFRGGELVQTQVLPVPVLKPGESRKIDVPLPTAVLGVAVRAWLEPRPGGVPDDNPANDVVETRFEVFEGFYTNRFESEARPHQPEPTPENPGMVAAPVPTNVPGAPPGGAFVTGLGVVKLPSTNLCPARVVTSIGCGYFTLPSLVVPAGGVLEFDHFHRFSGSNDGILVEYTQDAGTSWNLLQPSGGYPSASCGWGPSGSYFLPCFTGTAAGWGHVVFPIRHLEGQLVQIRFLYFRSGSTQTDSGWAMDNLIVRGDHYTDGVLEKPRFQRGPVQNPRGPLEAASFPNVWATGLESDSSRASAWEVLKGPVIDLSRIPRPRLSFDYWFEPEPGGLAFVQYLDPAGNWVELDQLDPATGQWVHREYGLLHVADRTQIRFLYMTPAGLMPFARAGLFVDDVLVGSLSAALERLDAVAMPSYGALDGDNLTVPVRVINTGAFSNLYRLTVRGPDPYWTGFSEPGTVLVHPGEVRDALVTVEIPYGGRPGPIDFQVVAQSLYDPLQRAVLDVPVRLSVSPRPDWEIQSVKLMIYTAHPDGWLVQDAQPNHITLLVNNTGPRDSEQRPRVVFYEHVKDGSRRAFNTTFLENVPEGADRDTLTLVNVSWMPRKEVVALDVEINPGEEIPEMGRDTNRIVRPIIVQPRPLPELVLDGLPGFAEDPQAGDPTLVGLNVRNVGTAPTDFAVDVAMLAGYDDAYLTSPEVNLKGNDLLRLRYSSDLEPRVDAVVLEARKEGAPWQALEPRGGYPYGCVLTLHDASTGCHSGISGSTGGRARDLVFDLKGFQGPTEFRFRFGFDANNGRTYEGFGIHRVSIHHFRDLLRDYNFAKGANGWSVTRDGLSSHTWTYRATDGTLAGAWTVPRDYQNPFTVGLKQVPQGGQCPPCLRPGDLGFAEMDWTPDPALVERHGGGMDLLIYIDPHDLQPEFLDDINRNVHRPAVLTSGFQIAPKEPIVLPDASAQRRAVLLVTNAGNHASNFQLGLRESPHFGLDLSRSGRPVDQVFLDRGQTLEVDLLVQAKRAPAGEHLVYIDALDAATNRLFTVGVPVQVGRGIQLPHLESGQALTLRQRTGTTLLVQNPGNDFLPVVLRVVDRPAGLASLVAPDEFTLAPFEARSVEFEFLNLGAKAGNYSVKVANAAVVCPPSSPDCNRFGTIPLLVHPYAAPRAALRVDGTSFSLGQAVRFRDVSTSMGATIVAWRWDFGDGTTSAETSPVHAYARPGVYEVGLRVTDTEGQSSEALPALVAVVNREPTTVGRVAAPPVPIVGSPVNFTAFESTDLDGGIQQVTWAFGDGTLGHGVNVTHAYRQAGTYKVTVAVEDGFGAVSVHVFSVTIADEPAAKAAEKPVKARAPSAGLFGVVLAWAGLVAVRRRRRD